jgi:phosphoglycerate dehydrogenase-like enzyme
MSDRPLVVHSEAIADEALRWLAARCRLVASVPRGAALHGALADADGLIVRTFTRVDDALLAHAPRLRVVGRAGTGLDSIDVAACRARDVEVVYTPGANTQAVVEYVISVLGAELRPRTTVPGGLTTAAWERLRADHVIARQMSERTLGVLGLGRIGRRVAEVAAAIGFRVLYHDLLDIPAAEGGGAVPVAPDTLAAGSDVISIHVDGRSTNRGLVGDAFLDRLKDDVLVINTSRGFVVDNEALARFLRGRPRARAHLDVHEPEPFGDDHPLLGLPNATLTPHQASRTETAMLAMSWVVRDVAAVLEGRAPADPAPTDDVSG